MNIGSCCQNQKRFQVNDGLGYLSSYTSRRRAIQAINDLGTPVGQKYYILIDKNDNSKSFILPEIKEENHETKRSNENHK